MTNKDSIQGDLLAGETVCLLYLETPNDRGGKKIVTTEIGKITSEGGKLVKYAKDCSVVVVSATFEENKNKSFLFSTALIKRQLFYLQSQNKIICSYKWLDNLKSDKTVYPSDLFALNSRSDTKNFDPTRVTRIKRQDELNILFQSHYNGIWIFESLFLKHNSQTQPFDIGPVTLSGNKRTAKSDKGDKFWFYSALVPGTGADKYIQMQKANNGEEIQLLENLEYTNPRHHLLVDDFISSNECRRELEEWLKGQRHCERSMKIRRRGEGVLPTSRPYRLDFKNLRDILETKFNFGSPMKELRNLWKSCVVSVAREIPIQNCTESKDVKTNEMEGTSLQSAARKTNVAACDYTESYTDQSNPKSKPSRITFAVDLEEKARSNPPIFKTHGTIPTLVRIRDRRRYSTKFMFGDMDQSEDCSNSESGENLDHRLPPDFLRVFGTEEVDVEKCLFRSIKNIANSNGLTINKIGGKGDENLLYGTFAAESWKVLLQRVVDTVVTITSEFLSLGVRSLLYQNGATMLIIASNGRDDYVTCASIQIDDNNNVTLAVYRGLAECIFACTTSPANIITVLCPIENCKACSKLVDPSNGIRKVDIMSREFANDSALVYVCNGCFENSVVAMSLGHGRYQNFSLNTGIFRSFTTQQWLDKRSEIMANYAHPPLKCCGECKYKIVSDQELVSKGTPYGVCFSLSKPSDLRFCPLCKSLKNCYDFHLLKITIPYVLYDLDLVLNKMKIK